MDWIADGDILYREWCLENSCLYFYISQGKGGTRPTNWDNIFLNWIFNIQIELFIKEIVTILN